MSANGTRGAVACGHPETARAAVEVLRAGGNAVDAAIAALFMACFTEPVLAAPGGGGFLIAHDGTGESAGAHLYDFFCNAPLALPVRREIEFQEIHADFGETTQAFHIGAGAAATPGILPGLKLASEKHGRLAFSDLPQPAIAAARAGIPLAPMQAKMFRIVAPILTFEEEGRKLFAPAGRLLEEGEPYANPALSEALAEIAAGRSEAVEEAMIGECRAHGGLLERADFAAYRVAERAPARMRLGEFSLFLNAPPALGGILSGLALKALERSGASDGPARLAALAEMEAARLSGRASEIFGADGAGAATSRVVSRGTTHVSVVDADGMAAAVTVSNGEGNGRLVPGMGFMLNNMLGEEDLNPAGFHQCEAGIRLSSMMAPTIAHAPVSHGSAGRVLALGTGGSSRIRTAVFNVEANLLLEGMEPRAAVEAARLHYENGRLDVEAAGERDDLEALQALQPDLKAWRERSMYFGGVHVAGSDGRGGFSGWGDPRRGGVFALA
ncbi:gamma-glutamyltransferase [Afifella sp. IM 167]|uniref:gamma-glutamyltransferase n=1 Tax=Afifella sp. IM 167 TaxID=2033586 RepID=UPI001CCDAAC7|nr:gamma-glutamyltransferase [Afifella sp. IM 167]MBZ8133635.1 gamma-glutamyltransferase [Afifella sp. IM 167]